MARNGSGTMSITYSFTSGSTIQSSQVNANLSDIAAEITNSIARDGQSSMTGQFKAATGSALEPSISFDSDRDTGLFRKTGNVIGFAAGGTEVATLSTSGLADANSNAIVGIPTGAVLMFGSKTAPAGWVRCNGRTIGNASSGATERANADTSALFAFLWDNYANAECAVSSGRGASAAADYAANKTIALPDWRGRGAFGLDDMGNTAASRLGSVVTSPTTNGKTGGAETITLSQGQLPAHTHGPGTLTFAGTGSGASTVSNIQQNTAAGLVQSGGAVDVPISNAGAIAVTVTVSGTANGGATASTGSGQAVSSMPPAFLTTFIMKL